MLITINIKKTFDKIQHPFMILKLYFLAKKEWKKTFST